METLGIVVPAYKIIYFEQALKSIANQTCKNFTVYIGNDGSCEDFETIVRSYQREIPIVYKRYSENLGGRDLVAHWERCIDMVKDEKWIWLFSDDDIMEATCVENFYKSLTKNNNVDLLHFNISRINEQNNIIENCASFPAILKSEDFLTKRLQGSISSCVMEYVFRKDHFLNSQRFQNFDLGWGTDDATWIKLGMRKGIHTIPDSRVFWRKSRFNISPNNWDQAIISRKLNAQICFANWTMEMIKSHQLKLEKDRLKVLLKSWFLNSMKQSILFFTLRSSLSMLGAFYESIDEKAGYKLNAITLHSYKNYKTLVNLMKTSFLKINYLFHDENKRVS
ncbi:MAG: glycosyltransferase family A protein [Ginsengibacter sp.]|jgi:glycosyltransferase involved in cell wall biosynthesis